MGEEVKRRKAIPQLYAFLYVLLWCWKCDLEMNFTHCCDCGSEVRGKGGKEEKSIPSLMQALENQR